MTSSLTHDEIRRVVINGKGINQSRQIIAELIKREKLSALCQEPSAGPSLTWRLIKWWYVDALQQYSDQLGSNSRSPNRHSIQFNQPSQLTREWLIECQLPQ